MAVNTSPLALVVLLAGLPAVASQVLFGPGKDPWYGYPYGGTTSGGVETARDGKVIAFRGDDREYSGWTVGFDTLRLRNIRRMGGLSFEVRGAKGQEKLLLGLLDDESDGKERKVQVQVDLAAYLRLDTAWKKVTIPFAELPDKGRWWNSKARAEVEAPFDWERVIELRLASNQGANSKVVAADHRFAVQLRDLQVHDSVAFFDRDAYWKAFRSDAPEREAYPMSDTARRAAVRLSHGLPADSIRGTWLEADGRGRILEVGFRFQDWVCAVFPLEPFPAPERDWSHHRGLTLDLFSPRVTSAVRIGIVDASHESWVSLVRLSKGWNRVTVPFRDFERDPWWQPEEVEPNRRLDLASICSLSVMPMEAGRPSSFRIGRMSLTNVLPQAQAQDPIHPGILFNRLGYLPDAGKRFLVRGMPDQRDWALLDSNGRTVHQGRLTPLGRWDASGDTLSLGDFSGWTRPGRYRLNVGDSVSAPFAIRDNVYRDLSRDAVRAFWFQRCGRALDNNLAGIWARKAGHPDTGLRIEEVPGAKGTWDASGGWYDAGDYGKYVVNAGITLSNLLSIQETWPDAFPDGSLSLPESGNGVGDLLDEMRWELSWIARMQDRDGGVFFKVGPKNWDGAVLPELSVQPRYVLGKSTSSTLDAAAVLAQASRVWAKVDPSFAKDCRTRAERAWSWASRNPSVAHPTHGGGTGLYQDGPLLDERFWAASELWIATGKETYRRELERLAVSVPCGPNAWWQDVGNLGWFTLARLGGEAPLAREARRQIVSQADSLLARLEGSAGRVLSENFVWGSNDVQLECALTLVQAWHIDPKDAYRDGALEALDYVLGRNTFATSFVTGAGTPSPLHPHHRLLRGDALPPFPGLLVGGPNAGREDDISRDVEGIRWHGEPPARSWKDSDRSYATNEICINWNSSLAWIAFWADRTGRAP